MKPSSFDYIRVDSVEEAIAALSRYDGEARILAGGQSLIPLLNMRLLRPEALIDINGIQGLDEIRAIDGQIRIGARTRYATIEGSSIVASKLPLLAYAIHRVADRQVRNRGTLGGSLCHADPAAQMPLCAMALDARMIVAGPKGRRTVAATDFFQGAFATAVGPEEMLIEVVYPDSTGTVATLAQQVRRHGDFPTVAVAASAKPGADGTWTRWCIAIAGLSDRPLRASRVISALEGRKLGEARIAEVSGLLETDVDPPEDVRASAEYRLHLAPIYVERALSRLLDEARR